MRWTENKIEYEGSNTLSSATERMTSQDHRGDQQENVTVDILIQAAWPRSRQSLI